MMQGDILAEVRASAMRRWFGIGVMAVLGGLLVYLGLSTSPAFGWQAFLLVLGAGALWLAESTRRATEHAVQLTRDGLRSSSGEEIASIMQIARVERGTFAMKPSNGFLLRLKKPRPRRWQPGLWWAMGRRVGIGGVTPGAQSKAMAQMVEALLAERDQASDQTN